MIQISLHNVQPQAFRPDPTSEVWGSTCCFEPHKSYLIEAASGAGKSTLLGILYGNRTDYDGRLLYDEADRRTLSADEIVHIRQHELAILFQELRLFPSSTAYENVAVKNQLTHFRTETYIRQLFEQLDIAEKWDAPVAKMSWGQQQRVAFIRALCQPCSLLLLDEPISHLDDKNAKVIADILHAEQQARGFGIIATSVGKRLPIQYDQTLRL